MHPATMKGCRAKSSKTIEQNETLLSCRGNLIDNSHWDDHSPLHVNKPPRPVSGLLFPYRCHTNRFH